MKNLSKEQFYTVMTVIKKHLSNHAEYLYHEYDFSLRLEGKIESLEHELKNNLLEFTDLDDE